MSKRIILKIGDVICVPLQDGNYAYLQYVYLGSSGTMIRVNDKISTTPCSIDRVKDFNNLLFNPVYVFLKDAVRELGWYRIGNVPCDDFKMPILKCTWYDNDTKKLLVYRLIKGEDLIDIDVATIEDPQYINFEPDFIYGGDSIEYRIREGVTPEGMELGAYACGTPANAPKRVIDDCAD